MSKADKANCMRDDKERGVNDTKKKNVRHWQKQGEISHLMKML